MRHHQHKGPTLPKNLLDQIGDGGRSGRKGQNRSNAIGRKARRKAERQAKKVQKRSSRQGGRSRAPQFQDDSELDDSDDGTTPPPIPTKHTSKPPEKPLKSILKTKKDPTPSPEPEPSEEEEEPSPQVPKSVRNKLSRDDAEIADLEKKLGIKSKKLPKGFQDDGLDFLLDGLEAEEDSPGGKKRKSAEDEEWLANKRRKASKSSKVEVESASDDEYSEDDVDGLMSGSEDEAFSEEEESNDEEEEEDDDGFDGFDEDESAGSDGQPDESDAEEVPEKKVRENPYVPPVAPSAVPTGKYIPPSLRAPASSDSEALTRLRRQLQGLLNRLSEANLLTILRDVEQLYQTNPRQYVTSTMIDLLLGLVADRTTLTDTFLILHAGFIAAVYKVIGPDFGAQLVERIVTEFEKFYRSNNESGSQEKQPSNIMSLVAEMYNFQVIGCNLVFDYIRLFLAELTDLNTELLLRIVKLSGPQLRQDDPLALKDIVVLLQQTVAKTGEANLSVRTKFMIETINNLKNNRMKTGVAASAVVSEHTVRMKKTLGSMNSRNIKGTEPLRIGLDDIKNIDKRGKWWLVGASWREGAPASETNGTSIHQDSKGGENEDEEVEDDDDEGFTQGTTDLLRLAKEQRMNTDIRRAIFVTIMSATDYKDAHIRLMSLRLKKSQEGEIPRVLLQCSSCEKNYNPYYTLIARRLCGDRKLKIAFQFSLWDVFKRMGEKGDDDDEMEVDDDEDVLDTRKIVNLARMFGGLFAEGSLPVSCLKVLNFGYLQPKTTTFLEVLFTSTILQTQKKSGEAHDEGSLLQVFSKVADAPQMARGLQYFLKKVVSKADIAGSKSEKRIVRWGCGVLDGLLSSIEPPVVAAN